MAYLGDYPVNGVVHCLFTTVKACGVPVALVSGAARVVKNALASGLHATGVVLTTNAGSITGLNKVVVTTSASTSVYTSGNYDIILSTGSVNAINVRGYLVGSFSIKARFEAKLWATGARVLTSGAVMWTAAGRLLSSGSVVWSAGTRTLTSGLATANSVWAAGTKVLTSGGVVWDAALSGHVTNNTFGLGVAPLRANTAASGVAGSILLDAAAPTTCGLFNDTMVALVSGSGAGQARRITTYTTGRRANVTPNWKANPSSTTKFVIVPMDQPILSSGANVWSAATRTLTSGSAVASSVWAAATRTLTSGSAVASSVWAAGGRVLSSGSVIWSAGTRTLTSGGAPATSVWAAATRTLTSGGADATSVWNAATRTLTSGAVVPSAALTEQAAVPAAAPTLNQAIMFLYQGLRNKRITTSGSDKIHTSATGIVGTSIVSFVTGTNTFTKGKYA